MPGRPMRLAAIASITLVLTVSTQAVAATTRVDLGGLPLDVSDSWTAQVFHIVDQISQWDQYAHRQYVRWAERTLKLDDRDRELLKRHGDLRRARGRGNGFEQSFLVDAPIESAAREAITRGLLKAEEATAEQEVLVHFSQRFEAIRESGLRSIDAFEKRLTVEATRITPFVEKLRRFAQSTAPVVVPVFLVTNPEERSGGGGADGGRLVVEVQQSPDPLAMLLHESLHALLTPHEAAIRQAAESVGLTWEEMNEGIAYAMAPGLTDDGTDNDTLIDQLARFMRAGRPITDNYVRFYTAAGLFRPLLRSALARNETVIQFLPKAAARWREVVGH
jgi:hypothetical protein